MKKYLVLSLVLMALVSVMIVNSVEAGEADKPKQVAAKISPEAASPETVSFDSVVVMYFHRTKRCPTCQKMGGYSEEAVKTGFPEAIQKRDVAFYYVDFQNKKNEKLAAAYKVTGPALVVAGVKGNRALRWVALPKIWQLVGDKDGFFKYVRDNVRSFSYSQK